MNYQGSLSLPHPVDKVWQSLLDPQVLQQCIAGCEKFEHAGEDEYKSTVKVSIGPVSARFNATVKMVDVAGPVSCTLKFAGQGGVAGFGKGEAHVRLSAEEAGTRLDWNADASVGGKLAQIGSRLIDASVRKMSDDFFVRFVAVLNQRALAVAQVTTASASHAAPAGEISRVANKNLKALSIAVFIVVVVAAVAIGWISGSMP